MLRGEQGERLGVSQVVLGEGLQRVRPRQDWGPGEGLWERGDEGAGSVSGCGRGSPTGFRGGCQFGGSQVSG